MADYICRIKNVGKVYAGVSALKGISFDIEKGTIHAIIGENGAGKSTLMNVLSGVTPPSSGEIEFDGKVVHFANPLQAQHAGIAMIHQELSLAHYMTVAENIYQGRELKNRFGFIDNRKMRAECKTILKRLGIGYIDPATEVKYLSVSQMQLVEIAKALSLNAKMVIMDEPTASLTAGEIKFLLNIMRSLRSEGVTILFISHKLEETLEISDHITVLRDGMFIKNLIPETTNLHEMVSLMVGRNIKDVIQRNFTEDFKDKEVVLEVKNLSVPGYVKNASFQLHRGEVLGLTGLVGAGRSELLEAIFGLRNIASGEVYVKQKKVNIKNPGSAIKKGIALLPEDRREEGLFLKMTVLDNMTIVRAKEMAHFGLLNLGQVNDSAKKYIDLLSIKTRSLMQVVSHLSGGNQQKTILARWLMNNPSILMMDEPTHGIDVGAKLEIYLLIDQIAASGVSVIFLSSELPEVLTMCDRIMVMHHGELRGILNHSEASQENIMNFTLNSTAREQA